jgi:hypothetical protein
LPEHGAAQQQADQLGLAVGVGLGEHLLQAPARGLAGDVCRVGMLLKSLAGGALWPAEGTPLDERATAVAT